MSTAYAAVDLNDIFSGITGLAIGDICEDDYDCDYGEICIDNECLEGCYSDDDCYEGDTCDIYAGDLGECVEDIYFEDDFEDEELLLYGEGPCEFDAECEQELLCVDSTDWFFGSGLCCQSYEFASNGECVAEEVPLEDKMAYEGDCDYDDECQIGLSCVASIDSFDDDLCCYFDQEAVDGQCVEFDGEYQELPQDALDCWFGTEDEYYDLYANEECEDWLGATDDYSSDCYDPDCEQD
ncbi:hypothetical protein CL614_07435, partial [archaeon]|nr:hypothetical protein [archaeon]